MILKKILLALIFLPTALMAADNKMTTLGITLFIDHPALTDVYAGIMSELKNEGFVEGKNLKIIFNEAYGSRLVADEIAQDLVKASVDVLIPISTPSAQAVVNADKTAHIPVVFSAVTDPIAAQLVSSLKQPGGYVTGVYDLIPMQQQLDMMLNMLPNMKTLGVIYNKSEINSVRIVNELKSLNPTIKIIEADVNSIDNIVPATRSLIGKVDAIFVPADNTVTSEIHFVLNTATDNRIPVFTSDHDSVLRGALASLTYDHYTVGQMTGKIIIDVLNGKNPGTIDINKPLKTRLSINTKTAQALNIKIPDALLKNAELVNN